MKSALALASGIVLATTLSACGLRGDLERPEPLFGNPDANAPEAELPQDDVTTPGAGLPPSEPQPEVVARRTQGSYTDPATGQTVWVRNELGGEKPRALPSDPVGEGSLPPVNQ